MKNRKSWHIIILTTFIFLVLLLVIQIKWLIETAETEKRHFTQSVNLSLDLTVNQILSDQKLCSNIQMCLLDTQCMKTKALKKLEWHKIDSLIKSNLKFYGIDCNYDFELKFMSPDSTKKMLLDGKQTKSQDSVLSFQRGNIQIGIRLPEKASFITKRISPLFISSILLILMVAASFIFTLLIYKKAEKRAEVIKGFILNIAHEFKTPISVIGLANSRIKNQMEHPDKEKLNKYLTIIDSEKTKIEKHLSAILNHAYIEDKATNIAKEETEIKSLIENAVLNIETILEDKNGRIETSIQTNNIYLQCNKSQIVNSLTNILDNACKYSNGDLKIKIKCFDEGNDIVFEIEDNGIGISGADIPFIFDKYFRVSTGNIHNIKGYGIGLSYVKEVVEKHGGKIELFSKIGSGSRFRIYLPIKTDKAN